jgi:hypothetical protein
MKEVLIDCLEKSRKEWIKIKQQKYLSPEDKQTLIDLSERILFIRQVLDKGVENEINRINLNPN